MHVLEELADFLLEQVRLLVASEVVPHVVEEQWGVHARLFRDGQRVVLLDGASDQQQALDGCKDHKFSLKLSMFRTCACLM